MKKTTGYDLYFDRATPEVRGRMEEWNQQVARGEITPKDDDSNLEFKKRMEGEEMALSEISLEGTIPSSGNVPFSEKGRITAKPGLAKEPGLSDLQIEFGAGTTAARIPSDLVEGLDLREGHRGDIADMVQKGNGFIVTAMRLQ